jgi:hypothetical protein
MLECVRFGWIRFPGSSVVEQPAVELQPPRETVVETSGEFREACPDSMTNRNGNPERSLPKGQRVGRNVQRLEAAEPVQ